MKCLACLILLLYFYSPRIIFGQIPNASFELWETIDDLECLVGWTSNNHPFGVTTKKVKGINDGEFALNLISNGISFEGRLPGYIRTSFMPDAPFNALLLSMEIDSLDSLGYVQIIVTEGEFFDYNQNIGFYYSKEYNPGKQTISIPLIPCASDTIHIEIRANSTNFGAYYDGYASIIVDDLSLEYIQESENPLDDIRFYPNPAQGQVRIEQANGYTYSLLASNGQFIKSGEIENCLLNIEHPGTFLLIIEHLGEVRVEKIVNLN
jgi:hypothetical protein